MSQTGKDVALKAHQRQASGVRKRLVLAFKQHKEVLWAMWGLLHDDTYNMASPVELPVTFGRRALPVLALFTRAVPFAMTFTRSTRHLKPDEAQYGVHQLKIDHGQASTRWGREGLRHSDVAAGGEAGEQHEVSKVGES